MIKHYRSSDILELMGPVETQYAQPQPGECDDQQVAGGDTPETRVIEMGATSGTFVFEWEMFTLKDRAIVTYEGNVLHDTGCVGGGGTVSLTYAGSSSAITVEVIPNCDPSQQGFGTLWNFTVNCPQ